MTQYDVTLRPAGLWPDPNPHTDAPPGGLTEAADVVIRRAGIVEPRPGLEDQSYGSLTSKYINAIHPYDGDFVTVISATTDQLLNKNGTEITYGGSSVNFADYHVHSAAFRDRLYVPSSDGVLRVEGADATTATLAGIPRAKSGIGDPVAGDRDADEWLADAAGTVAYRCVLAKEAADGELRLGPPSGRWQVTARTGGSNDSVVDLTIPVHSDWADYDLYVYRSEISSVDEPSDEMARVLRHTISAAEAAAGVVTLTDTTPEDERGEALYTNATQEGAANEYRQPPTVGTLCTYRDMIFAGRVTGRDSIVLPFTIVPTNWFNNSGTGETVDVTSSSTALANQSWPQSSDLYGLAITELGQDPQDADTYFSADTEVSYTGGGGWVLSSNALATSSAQDVELCEWMDVSAGSSFRIYFRGSSTDADVDLAELTVFTNDAGLGAALYDLERVISNVAYVINRTDETITASHIGNGVLLIETVDVGDTITIDLPRRLAENVGFDIAGDTATASENSTGDSKPNRLIWSALQIPEGFPPLQFLDLGSESYAIEAVMPSRYGVYAFKYDGIWRIDGRTPTTLSAEKIAEARLVHPKAVTTYGDEVYAWTDEGVVQITPNGIGANLSSSQLDVWLGEVQRLLPEQTADTGPFLAADRADGALYLGVPSAADSAATSEWVYRFDLGTQAWTRWDLDATHAAVVDGRLYVAVYGAFGTEATTAGRLLRARLDSDSYPHHDDSGTATVDSVSGSVVTVSGSGYKANVGDWFVTDNSVTGVITEVDGIPGFGTVDLTVLTVENGGDLGSAATMDIYLGPSCVVEWKAKTAGSPHMRKLWSDVALGFETLDRFWRVNWDFTSDRSETDAEIAWVRTPEVDRTRPADWRGSFVPRAAARCAELLCEATIHNPGATWALRSLQLRALAESTRTGIRSEVA